MVKSQLTIDAFPRSKTIAFEDADERHDHTRGVTTAREDGFFPRTGTIRSIGNSGCNVRARLTEDRIPTVSSFPRTYSLKPTPSRKPDARLTGFGGFPTPIEIVSSVAGKLFPKLKDTMSRTMSIPRVNTVSGRGSTNNGEGKEVPYISFDAVVGRNSRFHGLTEDQMDELGGVEYRALKVLVWIVGGVGPSRETKLMTVLCVCATGRVCDHCAVYRSGGKV